jgi:hypothetical protein
MADRDFDLINGLFCKLDDKEQVSGAASLTDVEQIVLLIWHSSGIIENGGFHYFYEQDLDAEAVAAAYDRIGCSECAEILRLSFSLFPDHIAQAGRDERVRYVEANGELIQRLDKRFWELDKGMEKRLAEYIRNHASLE